MYVFIVNSSNRSSLIRSIRVISHSFIQQLQLEDWFGKASLAIVPGSVLACAVMNHQITSCRLSRCHGIYVYSS